MSDQQTIGPAEISLDNMSVALHSTVDSETVTLKDARNRAEHNVITNTLLKTKGNVSLCAKILDIDRKWLMKKMEEFGIRADKYR